MATEFSFARRADGSAKTADKAQGSAANVISVLLEISRERRYRREKTSIEPELDVAAQRSQTTEDDHRVVPFRHRSLGASGHAPRRAQPPDPNEALSKYEGGEEREDTYRHRMMVNLAAFAFTIVLVLAGVWLAMQIADMRRNQDCLLSGRRNCAPIDVHAPDR